MFCGENDPRNGALEDGLSSTTLCFVCAGICGEGRQDCSTAPSLLPRSGTLQHFSLCRTQVGTEGKKIDHVITIQKQMQTEFKTQNSCK